MTDNQPEDTKPKVDSKPDGGGEQINIKVSFPEPSPHFLPVVFYRVSDFGLCALAKRRNDVSFITTFSLTTF